MSWRRRAQHFVFWGTALLASAVVGGVWFAYAYVTDSETLATMLREHAPRYFPGSRLVVGRVRVRPLVGDVSFSQIAVWQKLDGVDYQALRIPWLDVRHDVSALLQGQLLPSEVVVAQPMFRLTRRKDGTWNLQGFLADPWPGPSLSYMPRIVIQNGTVELVEANGTHVAILRDVSARIDATTDGVYRFEGSAKGDTFEQLRLKGTVDSKTGRITLNDGELSRLEISDALRQRIPAELHPALQNIGLKGGEIDVALDRLDYDPGANPSFHYTLGARLRFGTVNCPKLPFPLNDVSATVVVKDGLMTIQRAEGSFGTTTVRARRGGTIEIDDKAQGRVQLTLDVIDLEFDDRLRAWTPPDFASLWDEYQPKGRVSIAMSVLRSKRGGPIGFAMGVECTDVALKYSEFPYPVEHVNGLIKWEGSRIHLDLQTAFIGGKPTTARGTIDNPGPDAIVDLTFEGEAFPIDQTLFNALPADVREVVNQFHPTGSVRGKVHVKRTPPGPGDPQIGNVAVHAFLQLNQRCGIVWSGLPYPITDLQGELELHPDHWVFKKMRGRNGLAEIQGEGAVWQIGPNSGQLKTELHLSGQRVPFDDQLRLALQKAWQNTWAILRPTGSSAFDARILVEPQKENYHLVIMPEHDTRLQLRLPRLPGPGVSPGETFDMPPMDEVRGTFTFDNGIVTMSNVSFQFRGAPAHFAHGMVHVRDDGQFRLDVENLEVSDFRIDSGLCRIMPPLMAHFARRCDDGKSFRFRTNLAIGWSGRVGQSAWCTWSDALVVFNGNTIKTGLPLEHLQGQLDHLRGLYDGQNLEVHGALSLDSITFLGQQVTSISSPIDVIGNRAILNDVKGSLLDGEITGRAEIDLADTPRYSASLEVRGADLQRYTKTLPGRQNLRGLVNGQITFNGLGSELRNLQGHGQIHITQGDLGELPAAIRLVKVLNLSPLTKTAFDSADAVFRIQNGETLIDPIKFTGNAFSLRGSGTMSAQGELNLGLRVLYGRDERLHIPVVSDALREASGQIFQIQVKGTPAFPRFQLVGLLPASQAFRALGNRRNVRNAIE
jgi:hypothetical protein